MGHYPVYMMTTKVWIEDYYVLIQRDQDSKKYIFSSIFILGYWLTNNICRPDLVLYCDM
jgi:hypothetical protein